MATVTYDGEVVQFKGPAPENLGALLAVLHSNASSQGRVIVSFRVDGNELAGSNFDLTSAHYTSADVTTAPQKELFTRAIDNTTAGLNNADATIDSIIETLLTDSWSNAFTKLNNFLQSLSVYFELLANLNQFGQASQASWSGELTVNLKSLEASFGEILKYCETQQVAVLSSHLNTNFRPVLVSSLSLVRTTIRSQFAA